MSHRDCHAALKTEIISSGRGAGVEFTLAKLYWGKDDFAFSLHAAPGTYGLSGIQTTDFLSYLGFGHGRCVFVKRGECYSRRIDEIDTAEFAQAFDESYKALTQAEEHLNACGFPLEQPEGWSYFTGKPHHGHLDTTSHVSGDGHTAPKHQTMKRVGDDNFEFVFSWIEGGADKGWTTHYRPKRLPVSPEVRIVFDFLGLRPFTKCPEFDFERCDWRFTVFRRWDESPFGTNADKAHGWFDAHPKHFSDGVERLLAAQAVVEKYGTFFLPVAQAAADRREAEIAQRVVTPEKPRAKRQKRQKKYDFDVALSFAGTERQHAEQLATIARDAGFDVFYDNFYPAQLWGKDLPVFFDEIYRKRSRYCVIFVSTEYAQRMWTNHERQSALARQVEQRGKEYILPVKVDDTELPGMPPTVGHLALVDYGIDKIGEMLVEKLSH